MSNYSSHVWTIIITLFTFLLAFLVWFFGFNSMKNTLTSDNLQDAVRTSAYLAQDKAERVEPGAFIINKDKFKTYLNQTKIRKFGNVSLGKSKEPYTIYYLPDNADASNGNQMNRTHGNDSRNVTTQGQPWVADEDTTNSKTQDGDGYEAIRGVRVVVNVNGKNKTMPVGHQDKLDKDPNSMNRKANSKVDNNKDKYSTFTATDIVQTYGKNNNQDTPNDLTR